MTESLTWEATYAISLALRNAHPNTDLEQLSLQQIYTWTVQLDNFDDDPGIVNDEILSAIFQDWYEETINGKE
ncbi:MAG: Fe-S cluster assembly protein IscX [Anaerolineales bacterium]|nr:Fe-S cluster assembly protein IscX [Anaerolineales bacterium]